MKTRFSLVAAVAFLLTVCSFVMAGEDYTGVYGSGSHKFSLATGSPGELGLVKVLAEAYTPNTDTTI